MVKALLFIAKEYQQIPIDELGLLTFPQIEILFKNAIDLRKILPNLMSQL